MTSHRITALVISAIAASLLLAACGQSPIVPSSATIDDGVISVDFLQDDEIVGRLYVRAQPILGDYVPFLIEIPYVGSGDYRLDSLQLDFITDVIDPTIMLEPPTQTPIYVVSGPAGGSVVHLTIEDTGLAGNSTILLEFLAAKEVFSGEGLRLHAELGLASGDAIADVPITPPGQTSS
jgi:hypothetical protein